MGQREGSHGGYRFMALRINALGCLLLLTPVVLWSAVLSMAALLVAVSWSGTVGARSANAWASARARGLSGRASASLAGWWRAAAVLVLAVTSTVLTAAALRQFSPMGDWLGGPGIARPVVGALSLIVGGAIPGIAAVVVSARSDVLEGVDAREDELSPQGRAREGRAGGQRAAALLAAVALGAVNVVVLTSVTPLGEWLREGTGQTVAAVAVLAFAFATPAAAVWYANRTGDALR
ncbi:hypothetical protein [Nocardioides astragali]|uniref:Uncharacterized protein n=1 Tax=Nocardioides astragali TaxID=1776736 RepID=A0ABW2N1Y4_9ACTN|nr:hypothetical protein [Nocardioides astragali]